MIPDVRVSEPPKNKFERLGIFKGKNRNCFCLFIIMNYLHSLLNNYVGEAKYEELNLKIKVSI